MLLFSYWRSWPKLTYHPYLCGDQRPADMIAGPIIHPTLDRPDQTSDRKGQENDKNLAKKDKNQKNIVFAMVDSVSKIHFLSECFIWKMFVL